MRQVFSKYRCQLRSRQTFTKCLRQYVTRRVFTKCLCPYLLWRVFTKCLCPYLAVIVRDGRRRRRRRRRDVDWARRMCACAQRRNLSACHARRRASRNLASLEMWFQGRFMLPPPPPPPHGAPFVSKPQNSST